MSGGQTTFQERIAQGLKNSYRRRVMGSTQNRMRANRDQVFAEWGNLEEWRERAREIRQHTIEHLDAYLEAFANAVRRAGGQVHFAADKESANRYILEVAQRHGVRTVVKSKSMVSEELEVNQALLGAGITPYETDLGEFIVQLAGERPYHIVGPAIHKTREEIRQLFSELAGEELPSDARALTAFARQWLRDKFFAAEMGISGCNFGVAQSGAVVLVSNEGNARLTTTLPKVHVVVMGMERLVPTWEDLDVMVSLLTRYATGQKIISYLTVIQGPRAVGHQDGPEELHVVIVDNGRSQLLGTRYQEALHCIRCGNCSNVCPVFRHIGGHAYGGVYNGPIGAVLSPLMAKGTERRQWMELAYASSLCGACTDACPVKIPLHDYLVQLRHDAAREGLAPWGERLLSTLFGWSTAQPALYEMGQAVIRQMAGWSGSAGFGWGPLGAWTQYRDLPQTPAQTFRQWWKSRAEEGAHGRE